jgi:hypothetical protein
MVRFSFHMVSKAHTFQTEQRQNLSNNTEIHLLQSLQSIITQLCHLLQYIA